LIPGGKKKASSRGHDYDRQHYDYNGQHDNACRRNCLADDDDHGSVNDNNGSAGTCKALFQGSSSGIEFMTM
jgi:hypothetical protein